jgi:sulfite oxidase
VSIRQKGIWITYGTGVYDITNMIPFHPKSEELQYSAGSSIDVHFEKEFDFHKSLRILGILEKHRIGNLVEEYEIERDDLPFYSKEDVKKHNDV